MLFKNIFPAGSHQRQPCSCLSFHLKGLPWYYALNYICHLYKIIIIDSAGFYFAFYSHFYQDFQAACHIKIPQQLGRTAPISPRQQDDDSGDTAELCLHTGFSSQQTSRSSAQGFPYSPVVELTANLRLANAKMPLVCCLLVHGCRVGTAVAVRRVSSTVILFLGPAQDGMT